MSKRILCLILSAVMVFSLLPVFASAAGEDAQQVAEDKEVLTPGEMTTDSMVTNKWLTENGNAYDLTMSAYATGGTMTQELQSDVPLDIVLVLDQSGSMLGADMASTSGYVSAGNKGWTVSDAMGYYVKDGNNYYQLSADRGYTYTSSVHPYLTDSLLGTTGGEDWHTNWETHTPNYYVMDSSGNLCQLYSRSYGYVGGYDCQFYYYPQGSSSAVMIPFNSANGSTTASYSRSTLSFGTGSMNSNSNRLWTTVYKPSSSQTYNHLYYTKNDQKVYLGSEVSSTDQTAYTGELFYYSSSNQTRLDALREAAGNFVDTITERAKTTGADHRVAVVGFAGNKPSSYSSDPAHIIANSNKFNYVNTGFFSGGQFYNIRKLDPASMEVYANINQVQATNLNYYVKAYNSCPGLYENGDLIPLRYNGSNWTALYVRANDDNISGWWRLHTGTYNNNRYYYFGNDDDFSIESLLSDNGKVYEQAYTDPSATVYANALEHVNTGDGNNDGINDNLNFALNTVDAYGGTYTSYGIAMANQIFANNTETTDANGTERKRVIVVFTDGQPGASGYDDAVAGEALLDAATAKRTYGASIYTIGLYPEGSTDQTTQTENFMRQLSSMYFSSKQEVYASDMTNPNAKYYYYDAKENKTFAAQAKNSTASWYYFDNDGALHVYSRRPDNIYDANHNRVNSGFKIGGEYYELSNGNYYYVNYGYLWYDTDGYPIAPKRNADDARKYHAQFYKLSDTSPEKSGNYYFTASNSMELNNVFQTISESVQTPYTTVQLDGENSVLRDVITSHFDVTNQTVTFSLEKGTVASQGANPVFDPVTNPTSAESAILEGITYRWVTNDDGSKTLDVKGFDYSTNYVAYQHPGYKLIATVHGLTTNELGKLYSNESSSGVYKDDSMVAPLPMPYITKEADGSATYVMDFGAKMKIAEGAKFQVNVTNVPGSNGTFFKDAAADAEGAISYQLKNTTVNGTGSREGQSATNLTPFTGSDKVTIHGRFYPTDRSASDKTAEADASWKDVTVVPASSVYFDDSFNTNNTVLTVGDGSGYNVGVNASTAVQKDAATGNTYLFYTFNGTGIDVYCTTSGTGESIRAALYSGGIDDTASIENRVGDMVNMRNYSKDPRYNVPSIHFMVEDYNQYTLMLLIPAGVNYQLDGVRVYNPMGTGAQTIYEDTSENNAQYTNLHACLVGDDNGYSVTNPFDGSAATEASGVLFIDDVAKLSNLTYDTIFDAYQAQGPENEIYLNPGQAITFALDGVSGTDRFWIGLSAPDAASNASGAVSVNSDTANITVTSPVDMYYPITELIGDEGSVTITNRGESLISVTNLKYTQVKPEQGGQAKALFAPVTMKSLKLAANNGVDPDAVVTPDPTQPPTITEVIRTLISTFVNALFGSIARLFGH